MTMKRYSSVAWIQVGFIVRFIPTFDIETGIRVADDLKSIERVGEVLEVDNYRIRIRTYAPDMKPNESRTWKRLAYLDARPEDVRPIDNGKVDSSTRRLFARLDKACKRDN